jgi:hypothetical protein
MTLERLFIAYISVWVTLAVVLLFSMSSEPKATPQVEQIYVPYCMGASGRGMCKDVPYMGKA